MPVEPPTPSAEQLADWQALVEWIGQRDRSQVVAWDEAAAAASVGPYQVLITRRVHQQLHGAPPVWPARSLGSLQSCGWIQLKPA
jgi:hypothetical protein